MYGDSIVAGPTYTQGRTRQEHPPFRHHSFLFTCYLAIEQSPLYAAVVFLREAWIVLFLGTAGISLSIIRQARHLTAPMFVVGLGTHCQNRLLGHGYLRLIHRLPPFSLVVC